DQPELCSPSDFRVADRLPAEAQTVQERSVRAQPVARALPGVRSPSSKRPPHLRVLALAVSERWATQPPAASQQHLEQRLWSYSARVRTRQSKPPPPASASRTREIAGVCASAA